MQEPTATSKPAPTGDDLNQVVELLSSLVAGLDVTTIDLGTAVLWWRRFDAVDRLAAAGKVLLARRVDESDVAREAGLGSTAEWFAQTAGTSLRAGQELLATSKRVAKLSEVDAALRSGELSLAQVEPVANAAKADPDAQANLLAAARVCSRRELVERCAKVRANADPDPERTAERIRKARRLRFTRDAEGAFCLHGRGPVDEGAELDTVLRAITDEIFREAHAEGRTEPHEAYRWDALVEAARRAWSHMHTSADTTSADPARPAEPDLKPESPCSETETETEGETRAEAEQDANAGQYLGSPAAVDKGNAWAPGAASEPTENEAAAHEPVTPGDAGHSGTTEPGGAQLPGTVRRPRRRKRKPGVNAWSRAVLRVDLAALIRGHTDGDETCDIPGIGPVPVDSARRLIGESALHLVLTTGTEVRNVTYLGRSPNAAQRIALLWERPECARLGCARLAREWDHSDDYARTRHTRLDELDGLCGHDHALKTYEGWALVAGTGKRAMVPPGHPDHPGKPTRYSKPDRRPPAPPGTDPVGGDRKPQAQAA